MGWKVAMGKHKQKVTYQQTKIATQDGLYFDKNNPSCPINSQKGKQWDDIVGNLEYLWNSV